MDSSIQIGAVVLSVMGRDSGRFYVVVSKVSDNYVYIADGETRLLAKPKLKKLKHLRYNGENLESIGLKLVEGKQVFDAEIRSALRAHNTK
ncbi:MAG: RNA-binding protein [Clostridia bacterium]|nr:RNA-binding protein [Clostridia bacterium]